jgi:DNA-binding MarR family transcriptional regulator
MTANNTPIGLLLKQLDALLSKGIDAVQQSNGLTRTTWQLLHTISQWPGITGHEVKKQLQPFASGTELNILLKELTSYDLLVDNQMDTYHLSEKGWELHNCCLQQQTAFRQQVMLGISPEAYATTIQTLETMIRNLSH